MAMGVQLYNRLYTPLQKVPDYVSCSVTWQRLGPGTGTLVVSETAPSASLLLACNATVVPVRVTVRGRQWWGRVVTAALDRQGPPGTGTVTATLVDDWAWLSAMHASQSGQTAVAPTMSQFDTQTGAAATVAAYYINAAAYRLKIPVAASPPQGDTSPQITVKARMDALADLLTKRLDAANVIMPVTMWLPGTGQPYGLTSNLTQPTAVFWPQQAPVKPWLRWTDTVGGITKATLTVTAPKAYSLVIGMSGTDAARTYGTYTDTGLQQQLGPYALPEAYVDATDISTQADAAARGPQKAPEFAATASAAVTVQDGTPWSFPTDYDIGDIATIEVAGVSFQEPVSRVTVTDDRQSGLVFTPQVGDPAAAATSDELIVRAVSSVALQLRLLQTGR